MDQFAKPYKSNLTILKAPKFLVELTLKYPVTVILVIIITVLLFTWLALKTNVGIYETYNGIVEDVDDNRAIITCKAETNYDLNDKLCFFYETTDSLRYECGYTGRKKSEIIFKASGKSSDFNDLIGKNVTVDIRVKDVNLLKKLMKGD